MDVLRIQTLTLLKQWNHLKGTQNKRQPVYKEGCWKVLQEAWKIPKGNLKKALSNLAFL